MSTGDEFANVFGRVFMDKLRKSKPCGIPTGYTNVKVRRTDSHLTKIIFSEDVCNCCKRQLHEKRLIVKFKTDKKLTIFEADMLWMVLVEGKLPRDYVNYHKCVAGREFIENIDSYRIEEI